MQESSKVHLLFALQHIWLKQCFQSFLTLEVVYITILRSEKVEQFREKIQHKHLKCIYGI